MKKYIDTDKTILDACCGSRMFWFDKKHPEALYMDIRRETLECCDGKKVVVDPDIIGDFRNMPFRDSTFNLVVFDPPHFNNLGETSYTAQKYGTLFSTWRTDLKAGFDECMRVLRSGGILIFKWNEHQIKVSTILKLFEVDTLFGHKSGKASKTHWMTFTKD